MRIGVLAVQGAFIEHEQMLRKLDVETFEIRRKEDVSQPLGWTRSSRWREYRYGKVVAGTGAL